jgi:hypothetical protein
MDTPKIIRILLIALVIMLLAGLGGWYWYLKGQSASLESVSSGRGFGGPTPSFENTGGSTFDNIVKGLGFQTEQPIPETKKPPRLWRVLATPGAGHGFISGATSTTLRFLERSTGYLFESDVENGKTVRLTNTLTPQAYEAHFSGTGSPVIQRLDDERMIAQSLFYRASSTQVFGTINESSFGAVRAIYSHPKKNEVLAVVDDEKGAVLIRSTWEGGRPARVFSSSIKNWNIHWLADDSITLSEPAASGVPGSAYRVLEGDLAPIVRNIPGLTILPRAHSESMLIGSDDGTLSIGVRGSAASSTARLPIRTVPEKCVWAPGKDPVAYCAVPQSISSGQFLNDWYKGRIHTNDTWWKIGVGGATAEQILPSSEGQQLDVENPAINDAGEYISFRNAYDKSVWVLRIQE